MATPAAIATLRGKGISGDRIDEFKAAFALFDFDSGGTITPEKLGLILNDKFGQNYSADDLKYMLRQFGDENQVDFVQFATSMHEKMSDPRYNEAFGDAFDLFDTQKSGELTKSDLLDGMMKLGESITEPEAEEMLKTAKKKDDFVRTMTAAAAGGGGLGSGAPAAAPAAAGPAAAGPAGPAARPGPAAPGARPGGAGPAAPGGPPRPGGASVLPLSHAGSPLALFLSSPRCPRRRPFALGSSPLRPRAFRLPVQAHPVAQGPRPRPDQLEGRGPQVRASYSRVKGARCLPRSDDASVTGAYHAQTMRPCPV